VVVRPERQLPEQRSTLRERVCLEELCSLAVCGIVDPPLAALEFLFPGKEPATIGVELIWWFPPNGE